MYFHFHAVPTIFHLGAIYFLELFIIKNNDLDTETDKMRLFSETIGMQKMKAPKAPDKCLDASGREGGYG